MDVKARKRKVFQQLVEGYDFASQLQLLLSKPFHDHDPLHADELLAKILGSFDGIISDLGSCNPAVPAEGTSRDASFAGESPAAAAEDSGDSRKRPLGVNKGKRGCYKRKRKSQSRTVESNTLEDTHAWRKYGQKEILNAKFPRSYFRCTHKYTQGCNATKQVQKLEQDPGMFQITYIGNHTCNNANDETLTTNVTDSDNTTACGSSCILICHCDKRVIIASDIDQSCKDKQDENGSTTAAGDVKEEETTTNVEEYCDQRCPTGDLSLVWQDIMAFDDECGLVYCGDETSNSSRGVESYMDDFMVFGGCDFGFGEQREAFLL